MSISHENPLYWTVKLIPHFDLQNQSYDDVVSFTHKMNKNEKAFLRIT